MAAKIEKLQKDYINDVMNEWWGSSKSLKILITGKTGTGKSSLVNAIIGKEVAKVGKSLDPETSIVSSYKTEVDGVEVVVWDSPGLQDSLKHEDAYLHDIETNCKGNVDLFLYCISMQNTRFVEGNRDIQAMTKLTEKLGKEIWKNAVVVLSCANKYISATKTGMSRGDDPNERVIPIFHQQLETWKEKLAVTFERDLHLSKDTIAKLPIVPAGRRGLPTLLKLKDETPWLSKLWMESVMATKREAQPALIKMNLYRLKYGPDVQEDEFEDLLKKEFIIINDKAGEIGESISADDAAQQVGVTSGLQAAIAHILERTFSRDPSVTYLGSQVDVNPEAGYIRIFTSLLQH